ADGEGEKALTHVIGDLAHRYRHFIRYGEPWSGTRLRRVLLVVVGHGGPLLGGVLADAQHLPHGRCQAGDRHSNSTRPGTTSLIVPQPDPVAVIAHIPSSARWAVPLTVATPGDLSMWKVLVRAPTERAVHPCTFRSPPSGPRRQRDGQLHRYASRAGTTERRYPSRSLPEPQPMPLPGGGRRRPCLQADRRRPASCRPAHRGFCRLAGSPG